MLAVRAFARQCSILLFCAAACDAQVKSPERELATFRDKIIARPPGSNANVDGRHSKPARAALSMAGQRRLDHTTAVVASVVEDGVPGDFFETGVFRGGMSFVAAKTFELLGKAAAGRRTYLADSFSGLPNFAQYTPAGSAGGADASAHRLDRQELSAHRISALNHNSVEAVRASAKWLGLDMDRLRFVPGYFNESLPRLLATEEGQQLRLAVLRLDGDAFASTLEAIELLYPRLSPGGFLIIDDFADWPSCRAAIDLYRKRHAISEPITLVPHRPGEVVRGAYWRKQPQSGQELCISRRGLGAHALRIADGYLPPQLVQLAAHGQPVPKVAHGLGTAYVAGLRRPANGTLHMCRDADQ